MNLEGCAGGALVGKRHRQFPGLDRRISIGDELAELDVEFDEALARAGKESGKTLVSMSLRCRRWMPLLRQLIGTLNRRRGMTLS
jgi:hypothetical protein